MSATAFDVNPVCAQFDFFTCGSPRGSLRLALRRGFFCRLVHNSSLGDSGLQEKAESKSLLQATLTPRRRDLLGGTPLGRRSSSGLFQNLHRLAHLRDSEDQEGGVGVGLGSAVAVVYVDPRVAEPR